jgi:anti-anti-sigma factor
MNITEEMKDNISRIYLEGRFDANTCADVEKFIREKVEEGKYRFVINMEKVPFIASAGLRVILVFAKELRQKFKGDLLISNLQSSVERVFEISGLKNVLKIYDNMENALQSFKIEN